MPLVLSGTSGISSDGTNWALQPDSGGRVKMPNQPAWHLQPSHSGTATLANGVETIMQMQATNGYRVFATNVTVSSGRVTVPVTGKYWCAASWRQEGQQGYYQVAIFVNGSNVLRSGIWYSSQGYESAHCFGLLSLSANDYLEVRVMAGDGMIYAGYGDCLTFFSGWMVS